MFPPQERCRDYQMITTAFSTGSSDKMRFDGIQPTRIPQPIYGCIRRAANRHVPSNASRLPSYLLTL